MLIAEDEAIARAAAVAVLDGAGYGAVEAEHGRGTSVSIEVRPGIRVILADRDLPAIRDGVRLATCLRYRWPVVGVIMTSGKMKLGPGTSRSIAPPGDAAADPIQAAGAMIASDTGTSSRPAWSRIRSRVRPRARISTRGSERRP